MAFPPRIVAIPVHYIMWTGVLAVPENIYEVRFGVLGGRMGFDERHLRLGHMCPNWDRGVPYPGGLVEAPLVLQLSGYRRYRYFM